MGDRLSSGNTAGARTFSAKGRADMGHGMLHTDSDCDNLVQSRLAGLARSVL